MLSIVELHFKKCVGLLVDYGALGRNQIVSCQLVSPLKLGLVDRHRKVPGKKRKVDTSRSSPFLVLRRSPEFVYRNTYRLARRGRNERTELLARRN